MCYILYIIPRWSVRGLYDGILGLFGTSLFLPAFVCPVDPRAAGMMEVDAPPFLPSLYPSR